VSDGDALLKAILANRDDDTPRLVYADWLTENGQEARAEFIRVQVELMRWLKENSESPNRDPDIYGAREGISRMKQLWNLRAYPPAPKGFIACLATDYFGYLPSHRVAVYRRGFPHQIYCPTEDWLECADVVFGQYPIQKVNLTTHIPLGNLFDLCRKAGLGEYPGNRISFHEEILGGIWKGIKFTLP